MPARTPGCGRGAAGVRLTRPGSTPGSSASCATAVSTPCAAAVTPVLEALSPKLREVLWLREAMDMTYAEIAEVQAVPIGTVMSRLHAARKKAARVLRNSGR